MRIGIDGIVILGAGQAGGRAAEHLRAQGYEGSITLIGDELELPYERPPLSKEFLYGDAVVESLRLHPPAFYAEQRIEPILNARVAALDPAAHSLHLADGRNIRYAKLLIATGARARPWPGLMPDGRLVHSLRNMAEAAAIKQAIRPGQHLLIIGGGFIGLEIAASARRLGCSVTVLEAAPALLGRVLPASVAAMITDRHAAEGVAIRTAARIDRIETTQAGVQLHLAGGEMLQGDLAVIGIGALPNTELAEAAGLKCQDGILVDESCRTSDPDIFAAGDAVRFPSRFHGGMLRLETWDNAEKQAAIAAQAMLGKAVAYDEVPWMWTDQYDLNIQMLGLPEAGGIQVTRGQFGAGLGGGAFMHFTLADGRIRQAVLINAGRERRQVAKWMKEGAQLAAEKLADAAIPLRSISA